MRNQAIITLSIPVILCLLFGIGWGIIITIGLLIIGSKINSAG